MIIYLYTERHLFQVMQPGTAPCSGTIATGLQNIDSEGSRVYFLLLHTWAEDEQCRDMRKGGACGVRRLVWLQDNTGAGRRDGVPDGGQEGDGATMVRVCPRRRSRQGAPRRCPALLQACTRTLPLSHCLCIHHLHASTLSVLLQFCLYGGSRANAKRIPRSVKWGILVRRTAVLSVALLSERSLLPNGETDPTSLHGSCPTTKGEKWSATKWIHVGPFGGSAEQQRAKWCGPRMHVLTCPKGTYQF